MKSKNRLCIKNLAGALAIPVLVAILLQGICMAKGKTMIMNMTSFDNFVVYIAIVMITTIALSINLNSGRFDFSLGSMALLSSVIGAKITYSFLGGSGQCTDNADAYYFIWYAAWTDFRCFVCGFTFATNYYVSWCNTDL